MDIHLDSRGFLWIFIWIFMNFYGNSFEYPWISMDIHFNIHVFLWISMYFYGYLCISMGIHLDIYGLTCNGYSIQGSKSVISGIRVSCWYLWEGAQTQSEVRRGVRPRFAGPVSFNASDTSKLITLFLLLLPLLFFSPLFFRQIPNNSLSFV